MDTVNAVLVPMLALVGLALWIRNHKPATPRRSIDQVLDDVARLRAERLMPEIDQLLTCEALYSPSPRKENEQ